MVPARQLIRPRANIIHLTTRPKWPPVTSRRNDCYFLGAANTILKTALSPPDALPTLTAHFLRFDATVPHFPLPMVPVATLNFVLGSTPAAVIFTGVARKMSQPASPLAFA